MDCQTLTTKAMSILLADKNVDHLTLTMLKVTKTSRHFKIPFAQYTYPTFLHTDLTFGDLRIGRLFMAHMHKYRNQKLDGSMQIGITSQVLKSFKIIAPGGSQFESIESTNYS